MTMVLLGSHLIAALVTTVGFVIADRRGRRGSSDR
jgi:hypothetical protein